MPAGLSLSLFLTTVTHFWLLWGARCRTGAGDPWGPPWVLPGSSKEAPRDRQGSSKGPSFGANLVSVWSWFGSHSGAVPGPVPFRSVSFRFVSFCFAAPNFLSFGFVLFRFVSTCFASIQFEAGRNNMKRMVELSSLYTAILCLKMRTLERSNFRSFKYSNV